LIQAARLAVDVKGEAPVGVMVVRLQVHGCVPLEAEARPDHAGQRQPPFADVAVPAGRELADDEWLTAADVERDTAEVAAVGACLEYRLGRTRTSWYRLDVVALGDEACLLVLPVG
jgi:hypothetical protein